MELYFSDLVEQSVRDLSLIITPDTQFYVVSVLCRFAVSDQLYQVDPNNGQRQREALALLQARAQDAPDHQRIALLKRLGDSSLYISGFFRESLERSLVGVDYYVSMGGSAYSSLSDMVQLQRSSRANSIIYAELASNFTELVRVLTWVARETSVPGATNSSILRLYDHWQRTGSVEVEKKLRAQGLNPLALIKEPKSEQ